MRRMYERRRLARVGHSVAHRGRRRRYHSSTSGALEVRVERRAAAVKS